MKFPSLCRQSLRVQIWTGTTCMGGAALSTNIVPDVCSFGYFATCEGVSLPRGLTYYSSHILWLSCDHHGPHHYGIWSCRAARDPSRARYSLARDGCHLLADFQPSRAPSDESCILAIYTCLPIPSVHAPKSSPSATGVKFRPFPSPGGFPLHPLGNFSSPVDTI